MQNNKKKCGKLIVFEGISGIGKNTQISILKKNLEDKGYVVTQTEWNSDPYINKIVKKSVKEKIVSPMAWTMIQATDFLRRYIEIILPALESGNIVLTNGYIYTALAQSKILSIKQSDIEKLYSYAMKPDLILYFREKPQIILQRSFKNQKNISCYGSVIYMELLKKNFLSRFMIYKKMQKEYESVLDKSVLFSISANESCFDIFQKISQKLQELGINLLCEEKDGDVNSF